MQGSLRGTGVMFNSTIMQIDLLTREVRGLGGTNFNSMGMMLIILIFLYLIVDKQLTKALPKKIAKPTTLLPMNKKLSEGVDKDFVLRLNTEYKDHPYKRRSFSPSPSSSSSSPRESFEMSEIV